jgi:bla regulator protein blaR1
MIDGTGLTGMFDFLIEFVPDARPVGPDGNSAPAANGPTFQEALLDQLGLKLESRKSNIQVIVVDHVERPSEN